MTDASNPAERAAVLGIDYEAIRVLTRRVWFGTVVVLIGFVLSTSLSLEVWMFASGEPSAAPPVDLWAVAAGFTASLTPIVVGSTLMQSPAFPLPHTMRQQIAACAGIAGAGVLLLWLAVLVVPADGYFGLALGFVLVGPLLVVLSQTQLKRLIDRGYSKLAFVVSQWRGVPASQTILGGAVRWIIASFAIGLVESTGVALLVLALPALVLPVLVIRTVAFGMVEWLAHQRPPLIGTIVYGSFAVVAVGSGVAALIVR